MGAARSVSTRRREDRRGGLRRGEIMLVHKATVVEKSTGSIKEDMPGNGHHTVAGRVGEYLPDVSEYLTDVSDYVPDVSDTEMARGLGWVSVAIGVAETTAPRQVLDLLGLEDT